MAYGTDVRARAEQLYVERGLSYARVAEETGVAKTTLLKWAKRGDWAESRRTLERLKAVQVEMAVALAHSAARSSDPQQVYAAEIAAQLAGVRQAAPKPGPTPTQIAEALMDVLIRHPELGPLVRRERRVLIREVLREVERMESRVVNVAEGV